MNLTTSMGFTTSSRVLKMCCISTEKENEIEQVWKVHQLPILKLRSYLFNL